MGKRQSKTFEYSVNAMFPNNLNIRESQSSSARVSEGTRSPDARLGGGQLCSAHKRAGSVCSSRAPRATNRFRHLRGALASSEGPLEGSSAMCIDPVASHEKRSKESPAAVDVKKVQERVRLSEVLDRVSVGNGTFFTIHVSVLISRNQLTADV